MGCLRWQDGKIANLAIIYATIGLVRIHSACWTKILGVRARRVATDDLSGRWFKMCGTRNLTSDIGDLED